MNQGRPGFDEDPSTRPMTQLQTHIREIRRPRERSQVCSWIRLIEGLREVVGGVHASCFSTECLLRVLGCMQPRLDGVCAFARVLQ